MTFFLISHLLMNEHLEEINFLLKIQLEMLIALSESLGRVKWYTEIFDVNRLLH